MSIIKVMVNGLPGNVAQIAARHILSDPRFELLPYAMTGPEILQSEHTMESMTLQLIRPDTKASKIEMIKATSGQFLSVDFTHPAAVNPKPAYPL